MEKELRRRIAAREKELDGMKGSELAALLGKKDLNNELLGRAGAIVRIMTNEFGSAATDYYLEDLY